MGRAHSDSCLANRERGSMLDALRKGGPRSGEQDEAGMRGLRVGAGAFRTESQRAGMGLLKAKVMRNLCLLSIKREFGLGLEGGQGTP